MFGDKFNFGGLMKGAKKMQEMMEKAEQELAHTEVIGEAGAGAVKVTMTGKFVVNNIDIDPEILKESKEIVEQLIVSATNEATMKATELSKSKMMDASKLLGGLSGLKGKEDE